jgi:hypothetical protein
VHALHRLLLRAEARFVSYGLGGAEAPLYHGAAVFPGAPQTAGPSTTLYLRSKGEAAVGMTGIPIGPSRVEPRSTGQPRAAVPTFKLTAGVDAGATLFCQFFFCASKQGS